MLTLKTITPQQAWTYYKKENYYSDSEQQQNSQWYGWGAKKLKLCGKIKEEDFKNLVFGKLPNGEKFRGQPRNKNHKERAGNDCTFSAPKSVSLLSLVKGDLKLEEAHRKAVQKTLLILEARYAFTRVTEKDGRRKPFKTGNLVAAQFHHDTSRELDPHLHTHCVLLNLTQLPSGKWQSLVCDEIYRNRRLLDKIYMNELAIEVKKLGYEIEHIEHGGFEIKGFKPEHLEYFSKRRQQILAQLPKIKDSTWAEREKVWSKTRMKKGDPIPRQELMDYWDSQVKHLGIEFPEPIKEVRNQKKQVRSSSPTPYSPLPIPLNEALADAISHCAERQVAFKLEALENFLLNEAGRSSYGDICQAIQDSQELLYIDERRVTTQKALQRELATISLMKQGEGQVAPIAYREGIENFLNQKNLTEGQKTAIALAATTTDRFIAIEGVAGAGKTYALSQFKEIVDSAGYTIKGFAPSAAAAKVLEDELGVEANTVARLLHSKVAALPEANQIWIVDEAGLLSAKDASALLQSATAQRARVILVGDTKQLSAVEAGNPFKSLQNAGITTAYLDQSLRQRTQDLRTSVDLLAKRRISEALANLERHNRIVEIEDQEARINQLVADYMELDPDQREKTLVLAGTNAERLAITQGLREELKKEGYLGEAAKVTQLVAKDLTKVQMRYAHNYAVGDLVIPIRGCQRLGLNKGVGYEVIKKEKDSLILLSPNKKTIKADLKFSKAVYTQQEIEIAEWDKLKWKKNDRERGHRNGQEFAVALIEGKSATIQYKDGSLEEIDLSVPQHIDYSLVSTTYSSQGKTAERVLVAADNTIGSESFYVACSRAKYDLKLYTEDKNKLAELAFRSKAKENPLSLLREKLLKQLGEQAREEVLVGSKKEAQMSSENCATAQRSAPRSQSSELGDKLPPELRDLKSKLGSLNSELCTLNSFASASQSLTFSPEISTLASSEDLATEPTSITNQLAEAFKTPVSMPLSEKVVAAPDKDLAVTSEQLPVTNEQKQETKQLEDSERIPETNGQISHNQEKTKVPSNTEQLPEKISDLPDTQTHTVEDLHKAEIPSLSVEKEPLVKDLVTENANYKKLLEKIEELAQDSAKAQAQIAASSVEYMFRKLFEHYTSVEMKQAADVLYSQLLKLSEKSVNQFASNTAQKALALEDELKANESLRSLFSDYIYSRKQTFDLEGLLAKYIQIRGGDLSVSQLLTELSFHRENLESAQTVLDEYVQKQQHQETVEKLLEEYLNARDTANAIHQVLHQHGEHQNGALSLHTQQWQMELKDGSLTVTNIDDNREILKVNGAMVLKFSDDPNEQLKLTKFASWTRTELAQSRASHTQQLNNNRSRSRRR